MYVYNIRHNHIYIILDEFRLFLYFHFYIFLCGTFLYFLVPRHRVSGAGDYSIQSCPSVCPSSRPCVDTFEHKFVRPVSP